jgi:glycine cleavage system H protein
MQHSVEVGRKQKAESSEGEMSNVPPELKYSKEHEWVRLEGAVAVVGITDHAQEQLGDIVFVELPRVGAEARFMQTLGVIESVKAASDFFSPLSGTVVAVNEALRKKPETINSDCYGQGWVAKIQPAPASGMEKLLAAPAYQELVGKA